MIECFHWAATQFESKYGPNLSALLPILVRLCEIAFEANSHQRPFY